MQSNALSFLPFDFRFKCIFVEKNCFIYTIRVISLRYISYTARSVHSVTAKKSKIELKTWKTGQSILNDSITEAILLYGKIKMQKVI